MADLEKHALRRDRKFLVRLVLMLVIAILAGGLLFSMMTSRRLGTWAADAFGQAAEGPAPEEPSP
jgi:hypothetical protein